MTRLAQFALSLIFALSTVLVFAPGEAAAADCKGRSKTSCSAASSCHWVDGYKRKDGVGVKAHCRASKASKSKASKAKSSSAAKAKKKSSTTPSTSKKATSKKATSKKASTQKKTSKSRTGSSKSSAKKKSSSKTK